jgi:hypothetical protein
VEEVVYFLFLGFDLRARALAGESFELGLLVLSKQWKFSPSKNVPRARIWSRSGAGVAARAWVVWIVVEASKTAQLLEDNGHSDVQRLISGCGWGGFFKGLHVLCGILIGA